MSSLCQLITTLESDLNTTFLYCLSHGSCKPRWMPQNSTTTEVVIPKFCASPTIQLPLWSLSTHPAPANLGLPLDAPSVLILIAEKRGGYHPISSLCLKGFALFKSSTCHHAPTHSSIHKFRWSIFRYKLMVLFPNICSFLHFHHRIQRKL